MHKTRPDGSLIASFCDFCAREWDPQGADLMIEGHQGSLICLKCLATAYSCVVLAGQGAELKGSPCTMCLEQRPQPQWQSPANESSRICLRCIKQAATALDKDPESGWIRPEAPGPTSNRTT